MYGSYNHAQNKYLQWLFTYFLFEKFYAVIDSIISSSNLFHSGAVLSRNGHLYWLMLGW